MADASQVSAIVNANATWQNGGQPIASPTDSNADPILTQLQNQSGVISSSDQSTQDLYNKAISTLQGGADANKSAVTSQYNLKEETQSRENSTKIMSAEEAQRGYMTNSALLTQIMDTGKQAINDLEEQKNLLIQTGNADAAKSIADIQVNMAKDRAQNLKDVFNNLLQIANYKQTAAKNAADIAAQQFSQEATMTTLAAKYGVSIDPGETLRSLATKIAPIASKEEQATLSDLLASAEEKRANAQKLIADANTANAKVGDKDMQSMADYVNSLGGPESGDGKGFLSTLKNPSDAAKVAKLAHQAGIVNQVKVSYFNQGRSKDFAQQDLLKQFNAGNINATQFSAMSDAVDTVYKDMPATQTPTVQRSRGFTAPGTFGSGGLAAVQPFAPASQEALDALNRSLTSSIFR